MRCVLIFLISWMSYAMYADFRLSLPVGTGTRPTALKLERQKQEPMPKG